jgi:DNA-binding NarL/FixJ family response regulator
MPKIKVLLIEDNRLLRDGATALLNEQEDILAVASPGNSSALQKAKKLMPDVVLLDPGLKSNNSMKVLELIKKQHPLTEVIVMDLIPVHSEVVDFVKAGVAGFILKDATFNDFLHTIRSVVKGVKIMPPTITGSLFSQIVERAIQGGNIDEVISSLKMTSRERDVISQIAAGKSNREIANALNIAVYTVESHVKQALDKLALHTRLELATLNHTKDLPLKYVE